MRREIKFRAWDTETKEMSHDFLSKNWLKVCVESPYVELMQFTGLKDRDDKEIFEGDILICETSGINHHELRIVCYDLYQTRYKAVPLIAYDLNAGRGGWTGYELKYHNEVIGNIHEHPHLLKGEES